MESPTSEREKKADLFRELAMDAYHRVTESSAMLDSKTNNLLALAIGLVPLILGVFYYVVASGNHVTLAYPLLVSASLASGVALFIAAIVVGVWNYGPRDFSVLLIDGFVQDHKDEKLIDIKEITVATLGRIVASDLKLVNSKAQGFKAMLWLFAVGTVAFSIGFMILLTSIIH